MAAADHRLVALAVGTGRARRAVAPLPMGMFLARCPRRWTWATTIPPRGKTSSCFDCGCVWFVLFVVLLFAFAATIFCLARWPLRARWPLQGRRPLQGRLDGPCKVDGPSKLLANIYLSACDRGLMEAFQNIDLYTRYLDDGFCHRSCSNHVGIFNWPSLCLHWPLFGEW